MVATVVIVKLVSMFSSPRVKSEQEDEGLDASQHGEAINSTVTELSSRRGGKAA